jgi:predicted methyltransferase MtxX (methanogen marker protein 4)
MLNEKLPGDDRERTYLQLLIEGQAKAAIKGNVEAGEAAAAIRPSRRQEG